MMTFACQTKNTHRRGYKSLTVADSCLNCLIVPIVAVELLRCSYVANRLIAPLIHFLWVFFFFVQIATNAIRQKLYATARINLTATKTSIWPFIGNGQRAGASQRPSKRERERTTSNETYGTVLLLFLFKFSTSIYRVRLLFFFFFIKLIFNTKHRDISIIIIIFMLLSTKYG